jgi:hypothetical protein
MNSSFIGTGKVSNTVFDYLAGVTSDIQTQINNITGNSTNDILLRCVSKKSTFPLDLAIQIF